MYMNRVMGDMVLATSLITYSVYSLNRVTDIEEDSSNIPERVNFLQSKKNAIIFLSIFSYGVALVIGFLRDIKTLLIFLIPFMMGLIYSIKFSSFRMKDLFAMKNITVSLSWSLPSSFLPYIFCPNFKLAIMLFIFLFIKVFINTIVFDVRDIEGDRKVGAKTIPVIIGKKKTKFFLLMTNSILLLWIFICFLKNLFVSYLPVAFFSTIYGYWYIIAFCKEKNEKFAFDYLVDGEFLILAFIALFINHIII